MSTSKKTPAADRHHGGPGSSHQAEDRPDPTKHGKSQHGEPTHASKASKAEEGHVSGKDDRQAGKGKSSDHTN